MATFSAMTTNVTVLVPLLSLEQETELAARAAIVFERAEQTFSRFRADSELSRMNRSGARFATSQELVDALVRATAYEDLTEGLFNARVGVAMAACGYDRSFSSGALDRVPPVVRTVAPARLPRCLVDQRERWVERPSSVQIDLGGMIKGHAADRAAALLPACAAVDAGGDVVLRGAGEDGRGWLVDVEDPHDWTRTLLTFRAANAGVATSASNRRRWRAGDALAHHLIDPKTGLPADTDLAQATVVTATAERADVLAKAAFLAGDERGARLLERSRAAGVLVRRDGSFRVVGPLEVENA